MIKVLHAIHSLARGGAERQLCLLCNHFRVDDVQMSVFCVNEDGSTIANENVDVICARSNKAFSVRLLQEMRSTIQQVNPDIVQIWLPASVSIPFMFFAKLSGCKVIFSYRNKMHFHRGLSYPEFFFATLFSDQIVSNHIPSDSNPLFRRLYRNKSGTVINNAVHVPSEWHKKNRRKARNATFRFLFIGRLDPQKNCLRLVEAAARLSRRPAWRLDLFGEGIEEQEIRALISVRNLDSRVVLHGYSPAIYAEMQRADVLVLPSIKEGMPNVMLEAMSLGVPVIVAAIPSTSQILDGADAAILVNPYSVYDIAEKMENALTKVYDLRGLAKNAERISSRYSPSVMCSEYRDLYTSL